MSLYFPEPYDDEILYSIISRYHYYIGKSNPKETIRELFGKRTNVATVELSCNISNICKTIDNSLYDEDYLINKHTNLPFYYPFLNSDNQRDIISRMKNNNAQGIYAKIGIIAGGVCKKKGVYYCPECVKGDISRNGEAYFHRIHQVPGVLICPNHSCILIKYEVKNIGIGRFGLVRVNPKCIDFTGRYIGDNKINETLIKIAKSAQYLLNNNLSIINQQVLINKYKDMLRSGGFITPKNRVRQKKLNTIFKKYYNDRLLEMLDSKVDNRESNWLRCILRRPRSYINPIRHILFILLIYEDMESFIDCDKSSYNNHRSSWPCLNQICKRYKENVIKDCKTTSDYKTKKLVGTFRCEYCGFEYSRSIDQKGEDDVYKIGRIKRFGYVWENKLINLINSNKYNIRNMSRIMGCDSKTIVKYARKLGRGNCIYSKVKYEKENELKPVKEYRDTYSKNILSFMSSNPDCTRIEIRKALTKQYMWLYRNDKKWLNDNLPKVKKQLERKHDKNTRVDWNKRDIEIYLKIRNTYLEIMKGSKNIRITKSIIGNRLGISALLDYYLEKLPKTKKYLTKIVETVEEFQIRRVKKICRMMIQQNDEIKPWKVIRMAGLKKTCSINVIGTINDYKCKRKNIII
ncbi:TnsD family Tn7-like transposition protein [Clostridium beijerinckii]|uniref:TnsD family Tn7-like transposition protein n=1 Tax=Clostridium beijerinckii TaxID=1520 RepID=UPI00098CE034|nr:TnsD family Tn7-like transposition protein [Clostridium beijerinckii]NRT78218.1 putative RNA-binding Zn-ribbon protein involved in translation (DUF1610 family) [Clostridium beijerinckii]OOM47926.1 hypothetical protein CBEIJ_26660 [Clostridium beijerinckii]